MKKLVLLLFFLSGTMVVFAQDVDPKKALKKATRLLTKYNLDNSNMENLDAAKDAALELVNAPGQESNDAAWKLLGDIYSAYSDRDATEALLNPEYVAQYADMGSKSYEAYSKAVEYSSDDKITKKALQGMSGAISGLSSSGIQAFQNSDFSGAYSNFSSILNVLDLMEKNGMESPLPADQVNNQIYLAGLSALSAGDMDNAKMHYNKLKDMNYDEPELYEGLFKISAKEDEAEALKILNEGRTKYPENLNLLYAEINYYLEKGDISELASKLEGAIEQEPENISLYTTLGNVYNQSFEAKLAEGNIDEANEYFDKAKATFERTLDKKPDEVLALYGIGALYYNRAANRSQELKTLQDDYSAAGIKKYDALKAEIDQIFEQSLPYFQKAEKLNPNDRNTLIALKEIYARKNDLDVSNEFKARLENIEAGGSNSSSYFNK